MSNLHNKHLLVLIGLLCATLLVWGATPVYSQTDEIEGLTNYWPLDSSAVDVVGNNNGFEVGGLSYVSDPVRGQVLQCDGNNDYISVENQVEEDFTISLWIKSDVDSSTGNSLSQADGLIWANSLGSLDDFQLSLLNNRAVYSEGGFTGFASDSTVIDGEWHHLAIARRADGRFRLFVDGTRQFNIQADDNTLNNNPLIIFCGDLLNQNFYNGLLDEVKIFDRQLPGREIRVLAADIPDPATPTPTLTSTPTATNTPSPTVTPTNTPTESPTETPNPSATVQPSVTPLPTQTAAPSATATAIPTSTALPPTPTSTPIVLTCPTGRLQAESGTIIGDMVIGSSSEAEGGQFVHVPNADEFYTEFGSLSHKVDICVGLEVAGLYEVSVSALALQGSDNSFWVTIDDEPADSSAYWELPLTNAEPGVEPPFGEIPLTFRDEETFTFTVRKPFLGAGDHIISFRAREDGARVDAFEFQLIRENIAPQILTPNPQFGVIGATASLNVTVNDPDGTVPTITAIGLPPGIVVNPSSLTLSGTPTTAGVYTVQVTANDGFGGVGVTTFDWTIAEDEAGLPAFRNGLAFPLMINGGAP